MHRDPELFPHPLDYEPERFIVTSGNDLPYMPFGEGPRQCIGKEKTIILMTFLHTYIFFEGNIRKP